jgi:hypothetical protein
VEIGTKILARPVFINELKARNGRAVSAVEALARVRCIEHAWIDSFSGGDNAIGVDYRIIDGVLPPML